jgi:hypothetical protein
MVCLPIPPLPQKAIKALIEDWLGPLLVESLPDFEPVAKELDLLQVRQEWFAFVPELWLLASPNCLDLCLRKVKARRKSA